MIWSGGNTNTLKFPYAFYMKVILHFYMLPLHFTFLHHDKIAATAKCLQSSKTSAGSWLSPPSRDSKAKAATVQTYQVLAGRAMVFYLMTGNLVFYLMTGNLVARQSSDARLCWKTWSWMICEHRTKPLCVWVWNHNVLYNMKQNKFYNYLLTWQRLCQPQKCPVHFIGFLI